MVRLGLVIGMAVVALGGVSRAQPCTTAPCADAASCKRTADWVVVGTVLEYNEGGYRQSCHTTFPFLNEACSFATLPPTVSLYNAEQVRGRSDLVKNGTATITRQAACFSGPLSAEMAPPNATPYPGSMIAGQHYRFYGFDARPGFVIAEPAGDFGAGG